MLLCISALNPSKRSPPQILNSREIAHASTHSRARGDEMEQFIREGGVVRGANMEAICLAILSLK